MSPLPSSIITRCLTFSNVGSSGAKQGEQRTVDEDHLVVGVVDDVGELLGEQADVEGVQDSPRARRGEVELEVAGGVPGERGHAPVGGDPEIVEHPAELAGAGCPLPYVVRSRPSPVAGDDALVRVILLSPLEDVGNRQWNVLHQALHEART
jgi:hypothetical protein